MPVSLAFLDLDRFKLVNDAHGHLIGSELLALTGRRLQELSRKQDLCFRYGGDEFVILMPGTDADCRAGADEGHASGADGNRVSDEERAEAECERQRGPGLRAQRRHPVHAIIGTADARMYAVKSHGRGHVRGA